MNPTRMSESFMIRGIPIDNRLGFAPMGPAVYTSDGTLTEDSVQFYRSIARGGTGLLIQGCAIVAENARSHDSQLGIWSDLQIAPMKRLTEAVHAEGKKVICQLQHCGIRSSTDNPPAPSKIQVTIGNREKTTHEMTLDEIRVSQRQFAEAALRAVQAGYDGVELHCSHGWLISSFLSGVTNLRQDEYGLDRLRYLREIFQNIREIVPANFIVGVRVSGYVPDLETGLGQAREMDAMGVDYISVSVNYKAAFLKQENTVPEGYSFDPMIYAAQRIKEEVRCSVFAAKGIRDGAAAERVLKETGVDMVLAGRAHLCDPAWGGKALRGEEPNRCFECRGGCRWRLGSTDCPAVRRAARKME